MTARKKDALPILRVRKGATMKEIYAAYRQAFTAEALQKYTVDEEMVLAEDVLAELKALAELPTEREKKRA